MGTSAVRTVAVQAAPESAKARKSAGLSAISRCTGDVPSGPKTGSRPRREAARSSADGRSSGGSVTVKVELRERPDRSTRVGRSVDGSSANISDDTDPADPASRIDRDEPCPLARAATWSGGRGLGTRPVERGCGAAERPRCSSRERDWAEGHVEPLVARVAKATLHHLDRLDALRQVGAGLGGGGKKVGHSRCVARRLDNHQGGVALAVACPRVLHDERLDAPIHHTRRNARRTAVRVGRPRDGDRRRLIVAVAAPAAQQHQRPNFARQRHLWPRERRPAGPSRVRRRDGHRGGEQVAGTGVGDHDAGHGGVVRLAQRPPDQLALARGAVPRPEQRVELPDAAGAGEVGQAELHRLGVLRKLLRPELDQCVAARLQRHLGALLHPPLARRRVEVEQEASQVCGEADRVGRGAALAADLTTRLPDEYRLLVR
eukprot:scaffold22056_cov113-Isochrysis_galbana.AAC.12